MAQETPRAHRARVPGFWIACCMCLCCCWCCFSSIVVRAEPDAEKSDAQSGEAPEADAATKKLMAAHGLFQRGLFKLAAEQYADFLSEYPKHAQRTNALYALAVCQ